MLRAQGVDNASASITCTVHALLCAVYADAPARSKVLCAPGVTAFLACVFCRMCGITFPPETVVRWLGYLAAVLAREGPNKDQSFAMGSTNDGARRYTDAQMRERMEAALDAVYEGISPEPTTGFKGPCVLVTQLPYVDATTLFVAPFCHSYLYGVVKDLVSAMLNPRPRATRRRANEPPPAAGLAGGGLQAGRGGRGGGRGGRGAGRGAVGDQAPAGGAMPPPPPYVNEHIVLPDDAKRTVAAVDCRFVGHRMQNRPPRPVSKKRGNYQMEGWSDFVLVSHSAATF